ncbi:MAG TPA: IclR family transcriptional regulator [Bordetella sp.]|nr:IclR family transcriptional regulator [Bordetella sp.]
MSDERSDIGLKSVTTALQILEMVVFSQGEVGVSEVAEQFGVAKGGVYRHLQTLLAQGYLWQNPETSKYRAGIQCHLLGRSAAESVDLLSASNQPMKALRDATGITVTLAIYKAGKVLIVERLFGTMPMEIGVRPGSEFALHTTSQGKVFLAFGKPALWNSLENKKLAGLTKHSIVDVAALEQECQQVKAQGWAMAPEETIIGINAISAPVFDSNSACVAALTLVGSVQHINRTPSPVQVSSLINAARTISTQLGYRA